MNDAELKETLARLDADQTPCPCLVCHLGAQRLFPPIEVAAPETIVKKRGRPKKSAPKIAKKSRTRKCSCAGSYVCDLHIDEVNGTRLNV